MGVLDHLKKSPPIIIETNNNSKNTTNIEKISIYFFQTNLKKVNDLYMTQKKMSKNLKKKLKNLFHVI